MKLSLRASTLVCMIALIVLQCAVYSPVLDNGFLRYDDDTYVYENPSIKTLNSTTVSWMFARPYYRSYTPIALLSHAVDYALWGENPRGHHLSSLFLHSVNVVLVFILGMTVLSVHAARQPRINGPRLFSSLTPGVVAGAFVAAALYSVHPIRVESVAWISDRKDLLLALFLIPCVIAYFRYDAARGTGRGAGWFIVALVFNLLALMSKTIAIVTPLLLLCFDGLLLHRGADRATWKNLLIEKVPFFILSGVFGLLAVWAASGGQLNDIVERMTTFQRIMTPLYTIMFYLVKYLVPVGLTPVYNSVDTAWMALGAFAALLLIVGSVLAARKGRKGWLLALAGYVIAILPTLAGLSAGIQPWADRYTYVPSMALFLLMGGGIASLWAYSKPQVRGGVVGTMVILTAVLGAVSRERISIWKDSESLWLAAVKTTPTLPVPLAQLGLALADKGNPDGALEMYRSAVGLYPNYAGALYNMAVAFESKEMPDSAVQYYTRALSIDPNYLDAYVNLGNMSVRGGNRSAALEFYERALSLDGADADVHYNLGYVHYLNGDREKALESFQKAVLYSPNYASAYHNMGIVLLDLRREASAIESFMRAARLGSPEAQRILTKGGYTWR